MKTTTFLILFLFSAAAFSAELPAEHACEEHQNTLRIERVGFEHINHKVYFNDIFIEKLINGLWFIEEVNCLDNRFVLTASHIQYGDPEKTEFNLIANGANSYKLFEEKRKIKGDINCDGKIDLAQITQTTEKVTLNVTLNDGSKTNALSFALNDSVYQNGLCGSEAFLTKESLASDLSEILGANPKGYTPTKTCIGLNIQAGECDSMHVFWNPETSKIDWWRL